MQGHVRMEEAKVLLPLRVLADTEGWSLAKWLVAKGASVYRNQRVAVLRSNTTGAVDHALAPHAGKLAHTLLDEGAPVKVASPSTSIAIIEFCPHSIVFSGLCAICGEDVSAAHFADTQVGDDALLPVAYNAKTLAVTRAEAESASAKKAKELLSNEKLSLVLDLDHTLVHATDDPRAAAIVKHLPPSADSNGIAFFSLHTSHHPRFRMPACNMYVKLRPHLKEFLARVAVLFELHIYTMGSRPYADQIAKLIDPDKRLFRGRITSREDFEEGKFNQKSIARLFPCDDSMVLIVDDREDVWISGTGQMFMPNLVRAKPYSFWDGLHEAYDRASATNGSFAVKSEPENIYSKLEETLDGNGIASASKAPSVVFPQSNGNGNSNGIAFDKTKPISEGTSNKKDENVEVNGKTGGDADKQNLTRLGEGENTATGSSGCLPSSVESVSPEIVVSTEQKTNANTEDKVSHLISAENASQQQSAVAAREQEDDPVKDKLRSIAHGWWEADQKSVYNDHLLRLAQVLETCHGQFFKRADAVADKLFEIPANVKDILASMRHSVFAKCVFTFTGIFPINTTPEHSSLWSLATRHGARCSREYESGVTTHVIASSVRGSSTEKSKRAVCDGTAFCIDIKWLEDSVIYMDRRPELPYSLFQPEAPISWEEFRQKIDENRYKQSRLQNAENQSHRHSHASNESAINGEPPSKRLKLSNDENIDRESEEPEESRVLSGDEFNDALDSALESLM